MKVTVLNVFCYAIHLELRVVDLNLRVGHRYYINLAAHRFLLKEGPLAYADTDAHLRAANVVKGGLDLGTTLANQ